MCWDCEVTCGFVPRELNSLSCWPLSFIELFLTWVPFETSGVSKRVPCCSMDLPDHFLLLKELESLREGEGRLGDDGKCL